MNTALATLLPVLSFVVGAPVATGQSTYCAFEITVHTRSGTPVINVPVFMIRGENKSTFSETKTAANGIARLCDAPLEVVDIVVGFDVCGSVMVRALRAKWPDIQRVGVTYDNIPCGHGFNTVSCQVLLRVEDERGQPVANARFKGEPNRGSGSDASDDLGRLFRSLPVRETLEGTINRQGWEPTHVSVLCEDDVELKVVLHKH